MRSGILAVAALALTATIAAGQPRYVFSVKDPADLQLLSDEAMLSFKGSGQNSEALLSYTCDQSGLTISFRSYKGVMPSGKTQLYSIVDNETRNLGFSSHQIYNDKNYGYINILSKAASLEYLSSLSPKQIRAGHLTHEYHSVNYKEVMSFNFFSMQQNKQVSLEERVDAFNVHCKAIINRG